MDVETWEDVLEPGECMVFLSRDVQLMQGNDGRPFASTLFAEFLEERPGSVEALAHSFLLEFDAFKGSVGLPRPELTLLVLERIDGDEGAGGG